MDPLEPPPHASRVTVPDGESFIWQPRPGLVIQKASGILSLPLAQSFVEFYRPILHPGANVTIFDDFEGLTYYTREARELLTAFTRERLGSIEVVHFLLSSRFAALGVSAFKHAIGDERVCVYSERQSFLSSLEALLR